jgi:hypothetical protein
MTSSGSTEGRGINPRRCKLHPETTAAFLQKNPLALYEGRVGVCFPPCHPGPRKMPRGTDKATITSPLSLLAHWRGTVWHMQ